MPQGEVPVPSKGRNKGAGIFRSLNLSQNCFSSMHGSLSGPGHLKHSRNAFKGVRKVWEVQLELARV